MTQYKYNISGMDCASCSDKIEKEVSKLSFVKKAFVNFATASLSLESDLNLNKDNEEELRKVIKKVEPSAQLFEYNKGFNAPASNSVHGDTCSGDHSHDEVKKPSKLDAILSSGLTKIIASFIIFLLALFVAPNETVERIMMIAAVLLCGYKVLLSGVRNLFRLQFEETLLMSVAVVAAFIIGEGTEAVLVMLLFTLGEYLENLAVGKSRKDIASLTNIRPDTANLVLADGSVEEIAAESIAVGDEILLRNGDRVPLDCVVISGSSHIDSSAITGESLPVEVEAGDEILSGSINLSAVLKCRVKNSFANSAATRIIELVENSVEKKGNTEKLITKFARIYTPIVFICAILLTIVPYFMSGVPISVSIRPALVFLVASCPCAFVIAVPLGFYSAIGSVSKVGTLVKGGKYIEALAKTNAVVFDKTGTLTSGKLAVDKVTSHSDEFSSDDILEIAAHIESFSTHPIATSITLHYSKSLDDALVTDVKEISGFGLEGIYKGKDLLCGSQKLMQESEVDYSGTDLSNIYLALDNKLIGQIFISDQIKESARNIGDKFKEIGINRVVILSGDNEETVKSIAAICKVDEYRASLLPEEKVAELERIKSESGSTLFAGDGINDAPVLAMADTGVAMGLGSDLAIESADVVLMSGELSDLIKAIKISRKSLKIIWFLIAFSLIVKLGVLVSAAFFGMNNMILAIFADVGVSLIALGLAARIMSLHKRI